MGMAWGWGGMAGGGRMEGGEGWRGVKRVGDFAVAIVDFCLRETGGKAR